jgi:hypothetical protein
MIESPIKKISILLAHGVAGIDILDIRVISGYRYEAARVIRLTP